MNHLTPVQRRFLHWVKEREKLRTGREQGFPPPWSNDLIMNTVHWCNVDREHDRVTKWIRENWTMDDPYNHSFNMLVARIFNRPETLAQIGKYHEDIRYDDWKAGVHRVHRERTSAGQKVWNAAYTISTNGQPISKIEFCVMLFDRAWDELVGYARAPFESCAATHAYLVQIDGIGDFLSAQIIADLKNTEGHPLARADDWYDFVAPGPGSRRGLDRFWEQKIPKSKFAGMVEQARHLTAIYMPNYLCLQNFQNCLCEFDKYEKAREGKRPKRHWKPKQENILL